MLNIKNYSSYHDLSLEAAQYIYGKIKPQIRDTGTYNLGLATGNSPKEMYTHLLRLLSVSHLDLSNFHTFNLDEFYPVLQTEDRSFFQEMFHEFWQPLYDGNQTFNFAHGHILNGEKNDIEECTRYEKLIKELGRIDLQILGLGPNGHIGFNEPDSEVTSRTRKITIAKSSKIALEKTYGTIPEFGITMGIGTILEAREIVLIATGKSKKEVFQKLIKLEKPTPEIPASFLLNHPNTSVHTDLI
ncbi:glucosamine-6-phosphate deaminase [Candidatus Roizmanbacteria bacterium CG_4_10_14_0_2_um_filter_39_13]|uniref:Glucosamine-6-phosphate deaminase n=1 Tax=Candidatus Roizmanbacteria bacterium CG_4_10_14_0_2_um_filter_39_13 TaxID=1974825 RepID=A0A2M7TXD3_9BACT|nr:MAG: glucosamine-6-phosphate deaminase [Candidatus Roizmanbacteria bacterium CG_4_10_14_0_2_um_filter_39_13]